MDNRQHIADTSRRFSFDSPTYVARRKGAAAMQHGVERGIPFPYCTLTADPGRQLQWDKNVHNRS
jgi:hypothetical protein